MSEKSHLQEWMEGAYAQFRLDGLSHEEAMAKVDAITKQAIPKAVDNLLKELLGAGAGGEG